MEDRTPDSYWDGKRRRDLRNWLIALSPYLVLGILGLALLIRGALS